MDRKYELKKARQYLKYLVILIPIFQVSFLIFFSLVGIYEKVDTDIILQSSKGIITLSSTITLSAMTIYLVYKLNKNILLRYIGNFRERTYLYPSSRSKIFISKLNSAIHMYLVFYIFILSIVNITYVYFVRDIFPYSNSTFYLGKLLGIFNIVIMSFITSLAIILFSLIFGIKFQSSNVSLITAIVSIVILGNAVANSYILPNYIIFLMSIFICIVIYFEIKYLSFTIVNDDVMR